MTQSSEPSARAVSIPPIFVGGTGRSGTTVVARIIGAHPAYSVFPVEARLHVDRGGLVDLEAGAVTADEFVNRVRTRWYSRTTKSGDHRGFDKWVSRAELDAACETFKMLLADGESVAEAGSRLLNDLFMAPTDGQRNKGWVEMTPPNVSRAPFLVRMFPDCRIVNVVRDGRDVAASVATMRWGPDTPLEALEWWAERMLEGHNALGEVPRKNVWTIPLDGLVSPDRDRWFRTMQTLMGIKPHAHMRKFLDRKVDASRAHKARWRELEPNVATALDRRYRDLYEQLAIQGVDLPGPPEPVEPLRSTSTAQGGELPVNGVAAGAGVADIPMPPAALRFMGRSDEAFFAVGQAQLDSVVALTGLQQDDTILDVGCGYGRVAHAILRRRDFEGSYVGVDVMPRNIKWCVDHLTPYTDGQFRFHHIDVHNGRYNPTGALEAVELKLAEIEDVGSHSLVLLSSVFTHMYQGDITHYLDQLRAVLAPGGRVVATFFLQNDSQRAAEAAGLSQFPLQHKLDDVCSYAKADDPLHVIAYEEAWVRQAVAEAGLNVSTTQLGSWCGRVDAPQLQDVLVLTAS